MQKIRKLCSQILRNKFITTLWTEDYKKIKKLTNQYFYFTSKQYDYFDELNCGIIELTSMLSLNGSKLYKCTIDNPYAYSKLVKANKNKIYQNDIPFLLKYINDNNLLFSNERHVMFYDILSKPDLKDEDATKVLKCKSPITSISCYSTRLKSYYVFAWHPIHTANITDVEIDKKLNAVYVLCKNELYLLLAFTEFIKLQQVDVMIGYFSHGYDLPYTLKRLAKNSISNLSFALNGNVWMSPYPFDGVNYKFKIAGIDSLDMIDCLAYMYYTFRDNKLDTVAEALLGKDFTKLKNVSWRDWEDKFYEFIEYNIRDVLILKLIDLKLKLVEFFILLQQMSNAPKLSDVLKASKMCDYYIITEYYNKLVLPNSKDNPNESYGGGYVMNPVTPGISKNVAILDYASLYPTTGIWGNISPETFICSQDSVLNIDLIIDYLKALNIEYLDTGYSELLVGKRYLFLGHKLKLGIVANTWSKLYEKRKLYKKLMKQADTKLLKEFYDRRQHAVKIILNSLYGFLAYNRSRLYKVLCADAITFLGRTQTKYAIGWLNLNLKPSYVQYGDTDSVAFDSKIRLLNGEDITILNLFLTKSFNHNKYGLKEYANTFLKLPYYDNGKILYGEVDYLYRHKCKKRMFKITLDCGKSIITTEDHSLMVLNENNELVEKKPTQLKIGQKCVTIESKSNISNIEEIKDYDGYVYDVCMKDNPHVFFANDILVHNSNHFILDNVKLSEIKLILSYFTKDLIANVHKKCNPKLNDQYILTDFLHEDTMLRMYYGTTKKRYFGIRKDGSTYVHGMNVIRKDISNFFKSLLVDCCKDILYERFTYDKLVNYYNMICASEDYKLIGIHKKVTRDFKKYTKTVPGHVRGVLWAKLKLNLSTVRFTDSFYQFLMYSKCEDDIKLKLRAHSICLRLQDFDTIKSRPDIFELDYKLIFEKQVLSPLRLFLYAAGLSEVLLQWYINNPDKYKKNKKDEWVYKKHI